jgi:hypothetical protein
MHKLNLLMERSDLERNVEVCAGLFFQWQTCHYHSQCHLILLLCILYLMPKGLSLMKSSVLLKNLSKTSGSPLYACTVWSSGSQVQPPEDFQ